jgi:hypothetical protein
MKKLLIRPAFLSLATLLLAAPALADFITGRVVTPGGVGIPGVNIDCFDLSGNELDLANDGTDASGNFTTTVLDGPGVYRFVFWPPPPPATTHLPLAIDDVVVVGTKVLGDVTLSPGVSLSGRAVRAGSIPVANVTLSVLDGPTNTEILLDQTETGAFGTFNLPVPAHAIELRLDGTTAGLGLASVALELAPAGNTALGDILLPPGFTVSATVRTSGGSPVSGADLDFVLRPGGQEAYTPDDNTSASGLVSVVVAAGTYDIEICPKAADPLAGTVLLSQVVSGNLNLGIITLQNGVLLSGTVTDSFADPAQGVDVNVNVSSTGASVFLCSDNTDAAGAYSVRVPTGTYDVRFTAPGCPVRDTHLGVVVSGNTVLNGMLPAPPPPATAAAYAGDGINADTVTPVNAILGSTWSAPLVIGHPHGASGPLSLKIRTGTVNGPNFPSPVGGRLTEVLISGSFLSEFTGTHNGATGNVPTQTIPNKASLLGMNWALQYTVVGGGFADFSRAVFGTVACQ